VDRQAVAIEMQQRRRCAELDGPSGRAIAKSVEAVRPWVQERDWPFFRSPRALEVFNAPQELDRDAGAKRRASISARQKQRLELARDERRADGSQDRCGTRGARS
jgi:hypothetical protein